MTVEEVMQYRRATPFRPFVLVLDDGRKFVVRKPEEIGRNTALTWLAVSAEDDSAEVLYGPALTGAHVDVLESNSELLRESVK